MSESPVMRPRHWQTQQTRDGILAAANAILREASEDAITMPAIAARVGVTERTVYRHFATRDRLIESMWETLIKPEAPPQTPDALIERMRHRFRECDRAPNLAEARIHSRTARNTSFDTIDERNSFVTCVWSAMPLMGHSAAERRAAIVEILSLPQTWESLRTLWGFDGAEAAEAVTEALEVLLGCRAADL